MAVSGPTAPKTANQLAIGLESKDAARLIVDHDDMSIPVYGHSLGTHEAASSNLGLQEKDTIRGFILPGGENNQSGTKAEPWTRDGPVQALTTSRH